VAKSYARPVETYATNVMGSVHLLDAVRRTGGVRAVVMVTSDKCYENREWVHGYRETDRLGGRDPYSSSKACAELVIDAYRQSFMSCERSCVVASARAGNVIGGGDWAANRLLPDCIRAFTAGEPVTLRCPNAVRPWQHVLEPLAGYLRLAERLSGEGGRRYAEGWNLAPDPRDDARVGSVAAKVAALWGEAARVVHETGSDQLHEAGLLRLDATKAHAVLGWRPRWCLDEALEQTVAWYRRWAKGEDMRRVSLSQIAAYGGEA
jgi:CDP-glucose 4,6-dehydratase